MKIHHSKILTRQRTKRTLCLPGEVRSRRDVDTKGKVGRWTGKVLCSTLARWSDSSFLGNPGNISREDKDLGVASQAPPGSQASSRGEAKDSALLSSRDKDLLEPPERPQRSPACSCPWDSPGKNTRVGCHFLLQGIFPIQGRLSEAPWEVP